MHSKSIGRALRHRNYRLFFMGQLISLCGTFLTQVAMVWLVYAKTGSGRILGLTAFAGQIPAFALGPFAGVWVGGAGWAAGRARPWLPRRCARSHRVRQHPPPQAQHPPRNAREPSAPG